MTRFRSLDVDKRGDLPRLLLVALYASFTFFIAGTSRPFLLGMCGVYVAGMLWGVLRFYTFRTSPIRYLTPVLWGLVTCRLVAPDGMRLLLLPKSSLPAAFSEAAVQFASDVSASGALNLSVPVRGVLFALALAAGAVATADTLVHRSLYRPLLIPVLFASLLAYRDGAPVGLIPIAALVIAALMFFLYGTHLDASTSDTRPRGVPSAIVVGSLILLVAHTVGASSVQHFLVDPVRQNVADRMSTKAPQTVTRVELSSMEDAKEWVEQYMSASQPAPGNVADLLASGAGSPAQLEAVAASLASAGGVDIVTAPDGSSTFSLPKPGVTPDNVITREDSPLSTPGTGTTPAGPNTSLTPSETSTPSPEAGVPPATPQTSETGTTEGTAPTTAPSTTSSSSTTTESVASTTQPSTTPSPTGDGRRSLYLVVTLLLGTALLSLLIWRKRLSQRAAARSGRARVLAAWSAADRSLAKRTGAGRQPYETFRERSGQPSDTEETTMASFRELAELADQAAFSRVEPDPDHAEKLASRITGDNRQHR